MRLGDIWESGISIRCSLKMVKTGLSEASKIVVDCAMSPIPAMVSRLGRPVVISQLNHATNPAARKATTASVPTRRESTAGRPARNFGGNVIEGRKCTESPTQDARRPGC